MPVPPLLEPLPVLSLGKRLGLSLAAVTAYCVAVGFVVRSFDTRLPDWGAEASLVEGVILGMLMSFRNRVAYDRWWEARRLWGQLTNDIRNLACKLAAVVPREAPGRWLAAELMAAFPLALMRHLRGEQVPARDLPGCDQEVEAPPHAPLWLAARLFAVVADWKRSGQLDDVTCRNIDPQLTGLLDVCGGCERIRNTPLAPSYKVLLRTGLAINLLVAPWYTVADIGFWGVPVVLFACFFLLGIELIDTVVENPFGRQPEDLDLERYCQTIAESVASTLGPSSTQPSR